MTTLADVARHAGVASSTVSYVLSGKRSVSEETRERVRRAVEALGSLLTGAPQESTSTAQQVWDWLSGEAVSAWNSVSQTGEDVAAGFQGAVPTLALQMAVVTITIVPVLIVYPFVQKHFTKGVLLGAVKG